MRRYNELVRRALHDGNARSILLQPPERASRIKRGLSAKWLGYIDKFLLFTPRLFLLTIGKSVLVTDHSDAIWLIFCPLAKRRIVVVHDLFAVRAACGEFPEVNIGFFGRLYQRGVVAGLRRATEIISVSESTAKSVRAVLDRQCTVVHNPLDPFFGALTFRDSHLSMAGDYLLAIADSSWRKRRVDVIRAWSQLFLTESLRGVRLVIVGDPLGEGEMLHVPDVARKHVEVRSRVSDVELFGLYRQAHAVLVLSELEGFGWPIIEAQSAGTPVVIGNAEVLSEIAGRGAIRLENPPETISKDEWGRYSQEIIRRTTVAAGTANVERFEYSEFANRLSAALIRDVEGG